MDDPDDHEAPAVKARNRAIPTTSPDFRATLMTGRQQGCLHLTSHYTRVRSLLAHALSRLSPDPNGWDDDFTKAAKAVSGQDSVANPSTSA